MMVELRSGTMEQLYHVTEDDSVIGPVNRDIAHSNHMLHRAGMIFVARADGKILLTWRSPSKETFPDMHDSSCAFHVTFGESYQEAAKRELREETGIQENPTYLGKFWFQEPPEYEMVAVFMCDSDAVPVLDSTELAAGNFFSTDEIDKIVASGPVTPWLREGWKLMKNKSRTPTKGT